MSPAHGRSRAKPEIIYLCCSTLSSCCHDSLKIFKGLWYSLLWHVSHYNWNSLWHFSCSIVGKSYWNWMLYITQVQTTFPYVTKIRSLWTFFSDLYFSVGERYSSMSKNLNKWFKTIFKESQCDILQFANQGRMLFVLWWQLSEKLLMLLAVKKKTNRNNKNIWGLFIYYSNRGLCHPATFWVNYFWHHTCNLKHGTKSYFRQVLLIVSPD